jgi:glycosyltransferase involved in cell wall biosynthesis
MRILVAHDVRRERTGGMSRIMGFIHDQLALDGHSVEYFCADDVPPALNRSLSRFSFPMLLYRHAVAAARSGQRFDLINVHERSAAVISMFRNGPGNPAVVVTSYGVERRAWAFALEELRLGRKGPGLKSRIVYPLTSLWQTTVGLRGADHIFCSNSEDRDYLCKWINCKENTVTRICPAAEKIYAESAKDRNYEGARRLLFAATWRKNKGIEDMVPAFVKLAKRHSELALIVLGAGVPQETVRADFPESFRSRVHCVTTASEAGTAAAFAAADLFVLPSLFEGTPLTLMEAMMSGLPIVTTSTCGMKDVIQDGINGLLVPIRSPEAITEAVEKLMNNREYRRGLGLVAQAEALRKYTWSQVAGHVRKVYEALVLQ